MALSSFSRSGLPTVVANGPAVIQGTATGTYSSGGKNYAYYSFTGNGSLTVNTSGFADILVVGGGGGGAGTGGEDSGGGGAGGFLTGQVFLDAGSHTVTIGGGGTVRTTDTVYNGVGNASRIGMFGVNGGGSAQRDGSGVRAFSGGSGGAASGSSPAIGNALIPGQGNDGGNCTDSANAGGGGGGAGAVGASATSGTNIAGGAGGDGLASSITGTSTYYAGGGGGGSRVSTKGAGGLGGGGAGGQTSVNATAGTANTGGGGGGGSASAGSVSAAGGSGIVIVRVEV